MDTDYSFNFPSHIKFLIYRGPLDRMDNQHLHNISRYTKKAPQQRRGLINNAKQSQDYQKDYQRKRRSSPWLSERSVLLPCISSPGTNGAAGQLSRVQLRTVKLQTQAKVRRNAVALKRMLLHRVLLISSAKTTVLPSFPLCSPSHLFRFPPGSSGDIYK